MTEKIYLNDAFAKEIEATVETVTDAGIILDMTVFYARGGGQPGDSGYLFLDGKKIEINDTIKEGEDVLHIPASKDHTINKGDKVRCQLDWDRRYAHMRYHTAIHLIDAVVNMNPGYQGLITGSQIYEDRSRVDFSMEDLSTDLAISILEKANDEIKKKREVVVKYLTRDKALSMPNLARTKPGRELINSLDVVRVVEIEGLDQQADGGTHVKNLSDIGLIRFNKMENKGKNNKRVYFTVS